MLPLPNSEDESEQRNGDMNNQGTVNLHILSGIYTVIYICIYPCILLYSVCFHLTDDKDRKIIETTVITSRVGTHSYCRPCHNKG